jgi:hypothetical protein
MAALEIPIDEVVYFDVITSGSTGSAVDADATPTFSVYEESTDTAILGPTNFTKRTSLTGNYRGSFTASAANGFEAGKWYSVIGSATVSTVAGKCVCMNFRCKPAETVAGVAKVDISHVNGTTVSTATLNTNVVSISGDTVAADNLEAAFDGTGYTTNSNVVSVSGDTVAADNLEAAYDGTGYVGGTIKQKVDLDTIKTQAVTCAGGVTVPAATLASTTNITSAKLAADGLDSILTTAPTGAATNFREMMVQVWRRFFKKATRTNSQLRTYADDGITVVTSQAISSDGTTETQGTA